jgi:hypothetical protein
MARPTREQRLAGETAPAHGATTNGWTGSITVVGLDDRRLVRGTAPA